MMDRIHRDGRTYLHAVFKLVTKRNPNHSPRPLPCPNRYQTDHRIPTVSETVTVSEIVIIRKFLLHLAQILHIVEIHQLQSNRFLTIPKAASCASNTFYPT